MSEIVDIDNLDFESDLEELNAGCAKVLGIS